MQKYGINLIFISIKDYWKTNLINWGAIKLTLSHLFNGRWGMVVVLFAQAIDRLCKCRLVIRFLSCRTYSISRWIERG